MESSKPPPAPNPNKLIKQSTESNQETAARNFEGSLVNQDTPFGTLGYTQGSDGRWTANQQFTPEQQQLLQSYQGVGASMNQAGQTWADFIGGMDPNFDLSNTAIDQTILDAYRPEYQEGYDRSRNQRMVELANKGIKEGSTAFIEAMRDFDLNQGDVWSRLQRDARSQAIQQMLLERNQPFNEAAAIRSGMQLPQGMSFVNTPQYREPFIDTAGIHQQGYQNQLSAWEQQEADRNAMMSGLFSMGGTVLGGVLGGPIGAGIGGRIGGSIGGNPADSLGWRTTVTPSGGWGGLGGW